VAKIGIHQIRDVAMALLRQNTDGVTKQALIGQIAILHPGTDTGTISTQLNKLVELGLVCRPRHGFYVPVTMTPSPESDGLDGGSGEEPSIATTMSATEFEEHARKAMSRHYGVSLRKVLSGEMIKRFDFCSDDRSIVGDAKFFTLVAGERLPPAKFSIIAEHVWLLENTPATHKFLAFGNQREVPKQWLARYGRLVSGVDFYFIEPDGEVTRITGAAIS
jgi:hypothetical protein